MPLSYAICTISESCNDATAASRNQMISCELLQHARNQMSTVEKKTSANLRSCKGVTGHAFLDIREAIQEGSASPDATIRHHISVKTSSLVLLSVTTSSQQAWLSDQGLSKEIFACSRHHSDDTGLGNPDVVSTRQDALHDLLQ